MYDYDYCMSNNPEQYYIPIFSREDEIELVRFFISKGLEWCNGHKYNEEESRLSSYDIPYYTLDGHFGNFETVSENPYRSILVSVRELIGDYEDDFEEDNEELNEYLSSLLRRK